MSAGQGNLNWCSSPENTADTIQICRFGLCNLAVSQRSLKLVCRWNKACKYYFKSPFKGLEGSQVLKQASRFFSDFPEQLTIMFIN